MRLQKAPLVTSGLVLGLLGLGNLLKDLSLTLNAVCGIFGFLDLDSPFMYYAQIF